MAVSRTGSSLCNLNRNPQTSNRFKILQGHIKTTQEFWEMRGADTHDVPCLLGRTLGGMLPVDAHKVGQGGTAREQWGGVAAEEGQQHLFKEQRHRNTFDAADGGVRQLIEEEEQRNTISLRPQFFTSVGFFLFLCYTINFIICFGSKRQLFSFRPLINWLKINHCANIHYWWIVFSLLNVTMVAAFINEWQLYIQTENVRFPHGFKKQGLIDDKMNEDK